MSLILFQPEYFPHSRSSIYHSVEGPLTYVLNGELITEPRPHPHMLTPSQPLPSHTSQASFVSALAMEEESSMEAEKTAEPGPVTRQPHVMACYQNYLSQYQVSDGLLPEQPVPVPGERDGLLP